MDELSETLNRLLRDPQQMAAVQKLAGELFGEQAGTPGQGPGPGADHGGSGSPGLGALLSGVSSSGAAPSGKAALVKALAPYLRPERSAKLNRALRLAQTLRLATAAWERLGGEGGV